MEEMDSLEQEILEMLVETTEKILRLNLPDRGIAEIIALYASETYIFPDWVKELKLIKHETIRCYKCCNPLAKYEVKKRNKLKPYYHVLAENPADWAVDLVLKCIHENEKLYYFLAKNTNKRAIAAVDAFIAEKTAKGESFRDRDSYMYEINEMISANPERIGFLREHPEYIEKTYLMWNPAAGELVKDLNIPVFHGSIGSNSADWAVDLILGFGMRSMLDYHRIPAVSGNTNQRVVEYLIAHPDLIKWDQFSANPNPTAMEYTRAHPESICESIYANPGIMKPICLPGLVDLLMKL